MGVKWLRVMVILTPPCAPQRAEQVPSICPIAFGKPPEIQSVDPILLFNQAANDGGARMTQQFEGD
jgi:hypothetical protein